MKIISVSDTHIPFTAKEYLDFVSYTVQNADLVIRNGDSVDRARCTIEDILNTKIGKELLEAENELIKKSNIVYIAGNHDPDIGETIYRLLGKRVRSTKKFEIYGIEFTHGHRFDPINAYLPWRIIKHIAPIFFKTPSEWKKKNRKKWHKDIGMIYSNVIDYLEKYRDIRMKVIGHTHYPSITKLETGQTLADSGDFWDSLSWLEIDTKTMIVKMKNWRKHE